MTEKLRVTEVNAINLQHLDRRGGRWGLKQSREEQTTGRCIDNCQGLFLGSKESFRYLRHCGTSLLFFSFVYFQSHYPMHWQGVNSGVSLGYIYSGPGDFTPPVANVWDMLPLTIE